MVLHGKKKKANKDEEWIYVYCRRQGKKTESTSVKDKTFATHYQQGKALVSQGPINQAS